MAQPRAARLLQPVAKVRNEVSRWLGSPERYEFVQQGEKITAMPKEHVAAMSALQQKMRLLYCGIELAEVKNNKLLPMHSLAMSTALDKSAFPVVELELEKALAYLHRESLQLSEAPKGAFSHFSWVYTLFLMVGVDSSHLSMILSISQYE